MRDCHRDHFEVFLTDSANVWLFGVPKTRSVMHSIVSRSPHFLTCDQRYRKKFAQASSFENLIPERDSKACRRRLQQLLISFILASRSASPGTNLRQSPFRRSLFARRLCDWAPSRVSRDPASILRRARLGPSPSPASRVCPSGACRSRSPRRRRRPRGTRPSPSSRRR